MHTPYWDVMRIKQDDGVIKAFCKLVKCHTDVKSYYNVLGPKDTFWLLFLVTKVFVFSYIIRTILLENRILSESPNEAAPQDNESLFLESNTAPWFHSFPFIPLSGQLWLELMAFAFLIKLQTPFSPWILYFPPVFRNLTGPQALINARSDCMQSYEDFSKLRIRINFLY